METFTPDVNLHSRSFNAVSDVQYWPCSVPVELLGKVSKWTEGLCPGTGRIVGDVQTLRSPHGWCS